MYGLIIRHIMQKSPLVSNGITTNYLVKMDSNLVNCNFEYNLVDGLLMCSIQHKKPCLFMTPVLFFEAQVSCLKRDKKEKGW